VSWRARLAYVAWSLYNVHQFACIQSTPGEIVAVHPIEVSRRKSSDKSTLSERTTQVGRVITLACLER